MRHFFAVAEVAAFAEQKREELGVDIPIVAMGHLFTAGGQTIDGDGVRDGQRDRHEQIEVARNSSRDDLRRVRGLEPPARLFVSLLKSESFLYHATDRVYQYLGFALLLEIH